VDRASHLLPLDTPCRCRHYPVTTQSQPQSLGHVRIDHYYSDRALAKGVTAEASTSGSDGKVAYRIPVSALFRQRALQRRRLWSKSSTESFCSAISGAAPKCVTPRTGCRSSNCRSPPRSRGRTAREATGVGEWAVKSFAHDPVSYIATKNTRRIIEYARV